uniref:ATP synthase subunit a n=1 Tax=Chrysis angustula TaxID=913277 RepID=A0A1D9CJJ7_9HYME|nr:ATP synthase subunit 6 [Chrysis angustula]AOY36419.1 ATP synthase subunit 6 [Chrysis angustula]AOY36425.1 ATP synthase subunit 6 [Chrysis angustula]AOY36431.1 ATP synthase subunit 6 [Chrysis angustula]
MMSNLFEIFDPSTSELFSLNWMSSLVMFMILPMSYWTSLSRNLMFWSKIMEFLNNEIKILVDKSCKKVSVILFLSIFMFILMNNFLGLFSYIFTSSSHLIMSLYMSMSLWLGMMIYGWIKNFGEMFIHLLPYGTPPMLMVFMVLIETVSNLIRPITLAVRLTANMIAGHLLMVLIGDLGNYLIFMLIFMLMIQMLLEILELSVSVIQSYVFMILSVLYSNEFIIYEKKGNSSF